MCGRLTLTLDEQAILDILQERYQIFVPKIIYQPRYNITPGQKVLAVIHDGEAYRFGELNWGFVPPWAKDKKTGYKMINAKAETVDTRPAYKHSFLHRRCVILADSFYEWTTFDDKKIPIRIQLEDQKLFPLAGLWTSYKQQNEVFYSCSILTTQPNAFMANIHHRMPVILDQEKEKLWMDTTVKNSVILKSLLTSYPASQMHGYRVSTLVNNSKIDTIDCIRPFNALA